MTKNTVIGNVRIEHLHSVSSNGVRTADVSVFDQNTNQWKLKVKSDGITPQETTLFPEYWSKSRIIVEVDIAYENKIISQTRHNIWEGITPSGIKVEGYIAPNTTVYPLP
ncbi:EndoU domain-containing protein [Fusobacterium pseudoperiodonticum]|nr:EndoU domain-containing protein [Fusobacterium pseudoperiodonticum]MED5604879.1 EndoU domain-containing protein [Fusobacterium pseudoperiodonticum]